MGEIPIKVKLNFTHADGFLAKNSIPQLWDDEGPQLQLGEPICPAVNSDQQQDVNQFKEPPCRFLQAPTQTVMSRYLEPQMRWAAQHLVYLRHNNGQFHQLHRWGPDALSGVIFQNSPPNQSPHQPALHLVSFALVSAGTPIRITLSRLLAFLAGLYSPQYQVLTSIYQKWDCEIMRTQNILLNNN